MVWKKVEYNAQGQGKHHYMIRENAQRHLWQENAGAMQQAELGEKLAQLIKQRQSDTQGEILFRVSPI